MSSDNDDSEETKLYNFVEDYMGCMSSRQLNSNRYTRDKLLELFNGDGEYTNGARYTRDELAKLYRSDSSESGD
jgi:hypothetical protein